MSERALCAGCWEYWEYRYCRTVWLGELDCVLCCDCEELRGPRVAYILETEERLALSLRGETL